VSLHAQKKVPLTQGLRQLAHDLTNYSTPPHTYSTDVGSQIDALRRAVKRVERFYQKISKPADQDRFEEALLWLLVLAETVRHYYDAVWIPDASPERWCADKLCELERVRQNRCPYCGTAGVFGTTAAE